jgi:hypothetical protein
MTAHVFMKGGGFVAASPPQNPLFIFLKEHRHSAAEGKESPAKPLNTILANYDNN